MIGTFDQLLGAEKRAKSKAKASSAASKSKTDNTYTVAPAKTAKLTGQRNKAAASTTTTTAVAPVIMATIVKEPLNIRADESYKDATGVVYHGAEAARRRKQSQTRSSSQIAVANYDSKQHTKALAEEQRIAKEKAADAKKVADEKAALEDKIARYEKAADARKVADEKAAREKKIARNNKTTNAKKDADKKAASSTVNDTNPLEPVSQLPGGSASTTSSPANDELVRRLAALEAKGIEVATPPGASSTTSSPANDETARRLAALEAKGIEVATPPGGSTLPAAPAADTSSILSRLDQLADLNASRLDVSSQIAPVQTSAVEPAALKSSGPALLVVGALLGTGAIVGIVVLFRKRRRSRRRGTR